MGIQYGSDPSHMGVPLQQWSNSRPVIDVHLALQQVNLSNPANFNYPFPMGYGHMSHQVDKLNGFESSTGWVYGNQVIG